jgi:glycosyltransferase involved in cell wall biosynthesis
LLSAALARADADNLDLEVIVPAFNEQHRIEPTLYALVDELYALPFRSRVRVVDNGSSDGTADTVERVRGAIGGDLVALSGCSQRGKGSAVARGILSSPARYVGFCDADLATPAEALHDAVHFLDEGWAVVVGSRHCEGATFNERQPLFRQLGTLAFRHVTAPLSHGVRDTQCGFKFFTREAAQRIFSRTTISGFAFDVEVIARARAFDMPVKEMPVHWTDRPGSTFRPLRDGLASFADLVALRRAVRTMNRT